MSFFSKAWKSVKSAFKSIGKGIKSAARKVGKFMDKTGIVGQIALMFILPGLGGVLAKGFGAAAGAMAGSTSAIVSGVGKVLQTAGKFASTIGNAYKTVSNGISSFVSNIGKGMVNQAGTILGKATPIIADAPATASEGFKAFLKGVSDDAQNIVSPFRDAANAVESSTAKAYERNMGIDITEDSGVIDFKIEEPFSKASEDFRFYEVDKDSMAGIVDVEKKGFSKLVSDVSTYAKNTATRLPERVIDVTADMAVEGVGARATQALGITAKPEYTVQNITNVVPQFNSSPIQSKYESSGVNYGATPQSRIEYFAATQSPYNDYGNAAYSNFANLRSA